MPVALLPLFGAALGAAGGILYLAASRVLSAPAAALVAVLFWASASNAFREDRLIGAPRENLQRTGILARLLTASVWLVALPRLDVQRVLLVCVAGQCVSRAAVMAVAWVSRPAAGGLELSARLRSGAVMAALAQGVLAAGLCGARAGAVILISTYLAIRAARWWLYRTRGGIDGNGISSLRLLVEMLAVLAAALITGH